MRRFIRLSSATLLAVLLAVLTLQGRQLPSGPEDVRAKAALDELSAYYAVPGSDRATIALKKIGYTPSTPAVEWAAYPADRKFYVAYRAAVHADPVGGGEKYLALLSHNLAQMYEPARRETALQPYLAKPRPASVPFSHAPGPAITLSPDANRALMALADYHSASGGSARQVLLRHFRMSDDDAVSLLRRSASNREAFMSAAAPLDAPSLDRAIRSWTEDVGHRFESVPYEPALSPYITPTRLSDLPTISPHPPVPVRPSDAGGAAARFGEVMHELGEALGNFAGGGGFEVAARVVEGPGGVLFGNRVTAAFNPRPTAVQFVPAPNGPGSLQVTLSDGTRLVHTDVPAELAYVAWSMVTDTRAPITAAGTPIGIVGITDNTTEISCSASTLAIQSAQRFHTVVNPSLVDREIGWAALMVDSLPVRQAQLVKIVGDGAGPAAGVALQALLDSRPPAGMEDLGTWKVVDVPILLRAEAGVLTAERDGGPGDLTAGTRRAGFIEMRRLLLPERADRDEIKDTTYDKAFAAAFARMLPMLVRVSPDYRLVNQFARVLAVMRWAALNGASIAPVQATPGVPTPDALLLADTSIEPTPMFNRKTVVEESIDRLKSCQEQAKATPAVHSFVSKLESMDDDDRDALVEKTARQKGAVGFWCRAEIQLQDLEIEYLVMTLHDRQGQR